MFRSLLFVATLLSLTPLHAQIINDTPHDVIFAEFEVPTKADADHGVLYAEERITKLPQDQDKFYMTVMGDLKDSRYQQLLSWLSTNEQLKNFKSQCHFNDIDTRKVIYAERYEKTVPALPCIRVQQADGKTLYQASGENIPMSAEALAKGLSTECMFRFRRNRNPNPNPNPEPNPEPSPNPDTDGTPDMDEPHPDTAPKTPDDPNHMMTVLAILAALGGGLALGGGHAFASNLQQYRANHR